ncbi:hypothetical protein B0H17DRAFT_1153007 [Mycena rosella]|uniref:Uncharacterized protein n=1 Tax=Mycena rosella TaxID=1033263 RepID=A0AAD7FDT1_MYCRO|nr:hypothetical protein B0H17DRAFT_1153007 [Mycena rosella]
MALAQNNSQRLQTRTAGQTELSGGARHEDSSLALRREATPSAHGARAQRRIARPVRQQLVERMGPTVLLLLVGDAAGPQARDMAHLRAIWHRGRPISGAGQNRAQRLINVRVCGRVWAAKRQRRSSPMTDWQHFILPSRPGSGRKGRGGGEGAARGRDEGARGGWEGGGRARAQEGGQARGREGGQEGRRAGGRRRAGEGRDGGRGAPVYWKVKAGGVDRSKREGRTSAMMRKTNWGGMRQRKHTTSHKTHQRGHDDADCNTHTMSTTRRNGLTRVCSDNGVNKTEPRGNGTSKYWKYDQGGGTIDACERRYYRYTLQKIRLQMRVRKDEYNANEGKSRSWTQAPRARGGIISVRCREIPWSKGLLTGCVRWHRPLAQLSAGAVASMTQVTQSRRRSRYPRFRVMDQSQDRRKMVGRFPPPSIVSDVSASRQLGLPPLRHEKEDPTEAADATAAQDRKKKKKPTLEPRPPTPALDEENPLADIHPTSILAGTRRMTGGAKPDDDVESNFSDTEKESQLPWGKLYGNEEEEEEEALIEYEAETGGKGRHRKRKARDVEQYDGQDGDQNETRTTQTSWSRTTQQRQPDLPASFGYQAGTSQRGWCEQGPRGAPGLPRHAPGGGTRGGEEGATTALFPQPKGMSKKDYRAVVQAKYSELFADLSEDNANDPGARAAAWSLRTSATSKSAGYAIVPFTDNAIIWEGGHFFKGVYTRFKDAIKQELSDIKAMHQYTVVAMESRDAAARGIERPIIIDFRQTATEKLHRDTRRCVLRKMFLNDIHVVLAQRGNNLTPPKDMSWKWLEMAIRLHLRIVEWPVELKLAFPNAGFAITHIKEASVRKAMVAAMKARYLGTDDAVEEDTTRIVSWTEEECDMPLTDILDVPLVVCVDGSILLYARNSKDLLRCFSTKGKGKAKASALQESDDNESDDNKSNDDGVPNASKKCKSRAPGGRAAKRPRTAGPSTAQNTVAPAASGSNTAGAPSGTSGNSASGPGEMTCCYVNGQDFSELFAGAVMKYRDEPTHIQRQTQVWTAGGWRALPKGLGVAVSEADEARCELLRFYIGLADD